MSCKDCTKRYIGCHDNCADYQAFVKKHNEIKAMKQKAQMTTIKSSTQMKKLDKYQKRYGK